MMHRDEKISAYLDGELSPQEAQEVEQWLAADPEARQYYRHLSHLYGQVRQTSPLPGTPLDPERLMDYAQRRIVMTWGMMGGVTVAVAVGVVLIPVPLAQPPAPTFQISQYILEDQAPLDPNLVLFNDEVAVSPR